MMNSSQVMHARSGAFSTRLSSRPRTCRQSRGRTFTARPVAFKDAPQGAPRKSSDSYGFKDGEPEFTVPGLAAESAWNQKSMTQKYPPLAENIVADVVVIGAGIAGLTCAYQLAKGGKDVVVLESRVRGGGQTGRTTAHIMAWLDDYFYECEKMHGFEKTKLVGESMQEAINYIENVSKEEGIDCKFQRVDGYLVPHVPGESQMPTTSASSLDLELDVAKRIGLTDVEMVDLGGGPEVGKYKQALRFPGCGEFHPLMYLEGLAEAVVKHGGKIYEGTKYVHTEDKEDIKVETDRGFSVKCNYVVHATDSPINKNLAVHARQMAYRSYAVGFKMPKDKMKRAMYWDTAEPYHYVRLDEMDDDNYLLIVGGEDHQTGTEPSYNPYEKLVDYTKAHWPDVQEALLMWNGQVLEPGDLLHLHGKDPLNLDKETYIITGDSGQGMTGGTIGGIVVADLLLGRNNPWSDVYSPSRIPPAQELTELAEEGLTTAAAYAELVLPKFETGKNMDPESGAVVQHGTQKVAVYCDASGNKHAYAAACPHLGCIVHWNPIEKTFDCPCHGSHFDCKGRAINGPAKDDLTPVEF